MTSTNELVIGGVPEHFNLPWLKLMESGELQRRGLNVRWEDYPGGSGAMSAALTEGALDAAMLLTEGAVAGIANGGAYRIVSHYTETPLLWGIHVPAGSELWTVNDLRGARYAISRFGSGSHLMAFAHARSRGWPVDELVFETVGSLEGAIDAFEQGRADVFLWEKFMTQPLVDAGRFRRVGEYAAPWPAFVVCVSSRALREHGPALTAILEQVFATAAELSGSPAVAAEEIARRYGLKRSNAEDWLAITRWSRQIVAADDAAATAFDALAALGVIAHERATESGRHLTADLS